MIWRVLISGVVLSVSTITTQAQQPTTLTADAFEGKINSLTNEQIVDVRTPAEFKKNHILGAFNVDISSKEFKSMVSALDKSKPVLVYCLSGGRSARAAAYMRENGFADVYELNGGMLQWNASHKPVESKMASAPGMTEAEFGKKTNTDKIVLVDFYAKWCAPCKTMAPWIEGFATKYEDRLTVIKINADENEILMKRMKVEALPTLLLYKKGIKVWSNVGMTDQNTIEEKIKEQL